MSEVSKKIASEIRKHGAISFARFMDLALYCPVYGYYEKEQDRIGVRGDYYTNVSVGPLFGELLAFQFAKWIDGDEELSSADRLQIVEAGAHSGQLANDILGWLQANRLDLYQRLEYWIVEPSPQRRAWQEVTLAKQRLALRWASDVHAMRKALLPRGIRGAFFCNELLDALPVHRMAWDASRRAWVEWGVTLSAGQFTWTKLENNKSVLSFSARAPDALLDVLPDGYIMDWCPAAERWWSEAVGAIERGTVVCIDYGFDQDQVWAPERTTGTLRAYRNHKVSKDVLTDPGEQDITAHVDFTSLKEAGEAAGLKTRFLVSQEKFLMDVFSGYHEQLCAELPVGPEVILALKTLTHPNQLGRLFSVLAQYRS